jgi:hypothetical protein
MGHLEETKDYYMDNGKMVLTKEFLLKRGKCCTNGCRNCPFIKKREKNNEIPE